MPLQATGVGANEFHEQQHKGLSGVSQEHPMSGAAQKPPGDLPSNTLELLTLYSTYKVCPIYVCLVACFVTLFDPLP